MNAVRPLTAEEHQAFAAARLIAFELAPYFAHALLATTPLAAPGMGTFAVDRDWRLYLDPETLTQWGPHHSAGVLVHEVSHLVRQHAARADAIGTSVNREVWNYATDAAINDDLIAAGVNLPGDPLTPTNLGLPENGVEEDYYGLLAPHAPAPDTSTGEVGCGSGAGDLPSPWERQGPAHNHGLSETDQQLVRRTVAEAVRAHSKARGSTPAGLARWAEDTLTTPALPWQSILASTIRRVTALTSGAVTYTFTRPSRRRVPGVVLPAVRAPKVTAAVVIDTSGSMSPDDLAAALHETAGVIRSIGGRIALITCDAAANTTYVTDPNTIRLTGGGGTDMRVGITAALDSTTPAPDVVIVLTDGYTPWPEDPITARLIAVLIGDRPPADHVPAWATTLTVQSET